MGSVPQALPHYGFVESEVLAAFETIKREIQEDNVSALSKRISYPIKFWGKVNVNNPKDFITAYSKLITPKWKKAILKTAFTELMVTTEGVGFPRGRLWFTVGCITDPCSERTAKIIAFNSW
jgi:hypothetical protein